MLFAGIGAIIDQITLSSKRAVFLGESNEIFIIEMRLDSNDSAMTYENQVSFHQNKESFIFENLNAVRCFCNEGINWASNLLLD